MNILKICLLGIVLGLPLTARSDDTPVLVTTIGGTTVSVSPSDVIAAYLTVQQRISRSAPNVVLNQDGSFAINVPTFEYNGQKLRIHASEEDGSGFCKMLGYHGYGGLEAKRITTAESMAELNWDGKLQGLRHEENPTEYLVMETVACR